MQRGFGGRCNLNAVLGCLIIVEIFTLARRSREALRLRANAECADPLQARQDSQCGTAHRLGDDKSVRVSV